MLWRQHGERAPYFVTSQIESAMLREDLASVKQWQLIAAVLDRLINRPTL